MFEGIVADCRMLPPALVAPFARALPFVEPATVLALPVPATVAAGAVLSAALLAAFAGAMAVDILRGRTGIDCGCFLGALPQRIGWPLVVRNLLLVAGSLALPLLAAPAAAGEVRRVGEVQEDYARICQGPHRADGLGARGSVPRIRGFVGLFTHLPEGRDHLIRVPGWCGPGSTTSVSRASSTGCSTPAAPTNWRRTSGPTRPRRSARPAAVRSPR